MVKSHSPGASSKFGDDIDDAGRDGQKSTRSRLIAATGVAVFLIVNFNLSIAAAWLAVSVLLEWYLRVATRRLVRGRTGSPSDRVNVVLGSALLTATWSATSMLCWLSDRPGLHIVAIMVLTGQLIHAQAFAFRSRLILAVTTGIPGVTLIVLPLVFGGLSGVALVSTMFAIVLNLGYVAASARANMQSARSLRLAFDQAQDIAHSDSLTGLANRRMFDLDIGKAMAFWERRRIHFALLLVDLDGLKLVNDTQGHDAGDALLIEAARRLHGLIRRTDSLARIGGDEFAILLADIGDNGDVESFCRRIIDAFGPEIRFRGRALQSTPSVGAALFPKHGGDREAIYKAADLALYGAKNGGRNTWRIYDHSLNVMTEV